MENVRLYRTKDPLAARLSMWSAYRRRYRSYSVFCPSTAWQWIQALSLTPPDNPLPCPPSHQAHLSWKNNRYTPTDRMGSPHRDCILPHNQASQARPFPAWRSPRKAWLSSRSPYTRPGTRGRNAPPPSLPRPFA